MPRPPMLADARKLNFWTDGDTLDQLDAVRRLQPDMPTRAEMLRRLIKREWQRHAPSEPRELKPGLPSAIEFLRRHGGVRDDAGELRAMDAHKLRPGLVNNRRGLPLDRARELLVEHGYLYESGPDRPAITTAGDVLDLVRDEFAGMPRYPNECPF